MEGFDNEYESELLPIQVFIIIFCVALFVVLLGSCYCLYYCNEDLKKTLNNKSRRRVIPVKDFSNIEGLPE